MASATLAGSPGTGPSRTGPSGPGLRVGNVLGRAFPIWGRLIGPFCLLYAIQVLPTIIQTTARQQPHPMPIQGATPAIFGWPLIMASLFGMLIALVTHGAAYVATTQAMDGARPSVITAVQAAMGRLLPLLGTWICGGFLILMGSLLLAVPGMMVYVALSVMGPVCVLERIGPSASLRRSAALTRGSRWRIFGLVVLLGVLGTLTNVLAIPTRSAFGLLAGAGVQLVCSVILTLFSTITITIVYRDLVNSHDGFGGSRIAAVFD